LNLAKISAGMAVPVIKGCPGFVDHTREESISCTRKKVKNQCSKEVNG
jgi:hypothetical protein